MPVFLRDPCPSVLGVGAELKNTVCLTRGKSAFLGQHTGDLENLETLRSFETSISPSRTHPRSKARTDRARHAPRLFEYPVGA